jgi:hypothetical protein
MVLWAVHGQPPPSRLQQADDAPSEVQEVDCSNVTSTMRIASVNLTSTVRINNCSRRIDVYVFACGSDADRPLTIEVVGGITVPIFVLYGCIQDNDSMIANVSFVIRGVVMLYKYQPQQQLVVPLTPNDFVNPLASTLFDATRPVVSASFLVVDSKLAWVVFNGGFEIANFLLSVSGPSLNTYLTVLNSSLVAWSDYPVQGLAVFYGSMKNVRVEMAHSLVVASHHKPAKGIATSAMLRFDGVLNGGRVNLFNSSFILDAATNALNSWNVVDVRNIVQSTFLLTQFIVTAHVGVSLRLISVSAAQPFDHGTIVVERCHVAVVLNITDASLTNSGQTSEPGFIAVLLVGVLSASDLTVTISALVFSLTIDYGGLGTPLRGFMRTTSVGFSSLVSLSRSNIAHSLLRVTDIVGSLQETGRVSIAPYFGASQFSFGVVTSLFSVFSLFSGTAHWCNISASNCSLKRQRTDASNSSVFVSPSILSGIVVQTTSIVQVMGSMISSCVFVSFCSVSSDSFALPTDARLPMWNGVGIVMHGTLGNYMGADLPTFAPFLPSFMPDVAACSINHSTVVVNSCAVTTGLSVLNTVTVLPDVLRLSVVVASLSNSDNTSIALTDNSVNSPSVLSTSSSKPLAASLCGAIVAVVPSSTLSRVILSSHRAVVNHLASISAILCACGDVWMTNVHLDIDRASLAGSGSGGGSGQGGDALRLGPTSSRYRTTVLLMNFSMRLGQTTAVGVRSVLGNVTTAPRSATTALRTSSAALYTSGPILLGLPSCASNTWDGEAMSCRDVLRPADGEREVNWSMVQIRVDDARDSWCAVCGRGGSYTAVVTAAPATIAGPTSLTTAASGVTTAVLAMSVLTSSTGAASVLPRLQGMVLDDSFLAACFRAEPFIFLSWDLRI